MAIDLELLARYSTGVFDEGAAEITAYDPTTQRLFVVNANAGIIDVLDISDPSLPVIATTDGGEEIRIDLSDATLPDGFVVGGINSVAVNDGVIAIAVEADATGDNGVVAFYTVGTANTAPSFIEAVEVGALPDMVTFTPDGTKVLTANEGEPNDDYSIDPEGSISIIDVEGGEGVFEVQGVTTAGFTQFNDQIDSLREQGVRIFGPGATVAQDLEPEYIAVSSDSETAYVSLQENNALAVVDLTTNEVTAIVPLGFKDQNLAPTLTTTFFEEEELPVIGTSQAQGEIRLSGFSGLYFEGVNPDNGNLQFITHPDLGPSQTGNADIDGDGTEERVRTYLLPDLQPRFVRFEYNPNDGDLSLIEEVLLTRQDGTPLTGLPNLETDDGGRIPIDEEGNVLDFDPLGADLEGIVRAPDGTYWLSDEYRPAIYHFQADGTLVNRYVPQGLPEEVGTGVFPEVYNQRRANRGFEAIAYQDGKVYAFIQTPINNPESSETATIRILEFDPATETVTGEYLYIQDDMGGGSDKIGDAAALDKIGEFLVIERDSGFGDDSVKNIYRIDLANATNVLGLTLPEGETLEGLSPEELDIRGIEVVTKELYADLAALGYTFTDKPEGLAVVDANTVAVINDNDFGETDVPIGLGLVNLSNGLDPSDRDGAINIKPVPVLGMYQPDAIALFNSQGQDFIITANEGDARDYDTFSEEARVDDLILDPVAFPNFRELQQETNLGRLEVTTANGISAADVFIANLSGEQEVPNPVTTDATGDAVLRLNEDGTALTYNINLEGIDVGAFFGTPQTEDTGDDLQGLHFHNAASGQNGGVAFGILSPSQEDQLEVSYNADGSVTLVGAWEVSDTANQPLTDFVDALRAAEDGAEVPLYLNVHTEEFPGGEIRGQLTETTAYSEIYAYGARSFSIWDTNGDLVFDSGTELEAITAEAFPEFFNSDNDENTFDTRSDAKGPEPEGVTVGEIEGTPYAFIGLERVGGIVVYDLTDPSQPEFVQYINERDFTVPAQLEDGSTNPAVGDLGPEGLSFIAAEDSPNGEPLLVVANEVSGTTSLFTINIPEPTFTLELLHAADQEGSSSAINDAPNFSGVLNALRAQDLGDDGMEDNTLVLSSGDAFIPGLFFDASEAVFGSVGMADIQIQNELGFQAIALGNHEFDFGTELLAGLIDGSAPGEILGADFAGANFPYLSTNLDFSTDENLAGLEVAGGQTPQPNSVTSSVVIDVNGENIGVVGATTPTLGSISSPGGLGISPSPFGSNPTEAELDALASEIQLEVDTLLAANPDMNKVVLLAHMQQISIEEALAERLENVDIIVAGGSNTRLFDENDRPRDGDSIQGDYPNFITNAGGTTTAVVNTDGSYKYVGRLVIDFDGDGNIIPESYDPEISGAYATDDQGVADLNAAGLIDPEIQEIADAIEAQIIATESNVFGVSEVFLNGNRSGELEEPLDLDGVRTQETNLGNLTADANLATAQEIDPTVVASVKNGGGIRASIGSVVVPPGGTEAVRVPNEEIVVDGQVVKPEGGISQNDIQTALAFNNGLTLLTLTKEELVAVLEHGVSALPDVSGRYSQISGIQFSFDPDLPAGDRIQNAAIVDENDDIVAELVVDGEMAGDATEQFRIVTLDFLATPRFDENGNYTSGGDGYPFPNTNTDPTLGQVGDPDVITRVNPVPLTQEGVTTGDATFAEDGTEQDALAEYLFDNFLDTPFSEEDTTRVLDERIQNLNFREDDIFPDPGLAFEPVFGSLEGEEIDIVGSNQLVFAGAMDDLIDTTESDGGNRVYGQSGNDTFVLGTGDRALGGSGDDRFFFIGGESMATGGVGADQFWIANAEIPQSANTIVDFELGTDVLGVAGLGIGFDDLTLTQDAANTSIALGNDELAKLLGVTATDLSADNFVFM